MTQSFNTRKNALAEKINGDQKKTYIFTNKDLLLITQIVKKINSDKKKIKQEEVK